MKIITISREFGSGGRELGKRLSDTLGWDYYDREIISAIAAKRGMDEGYVERALTSRSWQSVPLTYRRSFAGMRSDQLELLLEQKRVIEGIAKQGRDCVIVGRNADLLLAEHHPLNLFVCASMEARLARCLSRAEDEEQLSPKRMEQNIRRIDKNRARTRELLSDSPWGERSAYHLTVNTTGWELRELAPAIAGLASCWFGRTQ